MPGRALSTAYRRAPAASSPVRSPAPSPRDKPVGEPLLDLSSVPAPPKKYKATDPNIRARGRRRFAADHRSEPIHSLTWLAAARVCRCSSLRFSARREAISTSLRVR